MSTIAKLDNETRAALTMTAAAITRLEATMITHLHEEGVLLAAIKMLKRKLKEAEDEHKHIIASISTIRQSITQMKAVEQNLRRTLSPIKHLPEEALVYIFNLSIQEMDQMRHIGAANSQLISGANRYPTLQLGWVCRRWRSIIESHSILRTIIGISLENLFLPSAESRSLELEARSHFLGLAQPDLHSLFIYHWNSKSAESLLGLLGPGKASWKELNLFIAEEPRDPWDILRLHTDKLILYRKSMVNLRHFTPLMRSVTTLSIYGPPPTWGSLPWIHLRSLTIKNYAKVNGETSTPLTFGPQQFISLLDAATELTSLALDIDINENTGLTNGASAITHRNLISISLHLRHFSRAKGPFGVQFKAPSLQRLELISLQDTPYGDDFPFLMPWNDPKVLSLPTMDDNGVLLAAELSKWLPRVHTLEVTGRNVNTLFIFIRALLDHRHQSFPKLNTLFIADSDLRGEALIELLESKLRRVRGSTADVCAISNIKMYNSPGVTVAHWARVQELLSKGQGMNG